MKIVSLISTNELSTADEAAEDLFVDLMADIFTEIILENEECNRVCKDQHS